jgi:hypothetical protein
MFTGLLTSVTHRLQSCLATSTRWFLILREHYKAAEGLREARGTKLLRVWLSPDQRAQFDASKTFEVVGANSGKRYRISYGTGNNIHELDDAGRCVMGWCFVPSGYLVAGDVMLAQKIALETDEKAALKLANRFPMQPSERSNANMLRSRPVC